MKLYEIAEEYENLLAAIDAGEIPEEALADTLESIETLLDDKADNIACLIKNLEAESEAIKAEEKRLAERRKAKENRAESLKAYLSATLIKSGKLKVETARNSISFRSSEKVCIKNEESFLKWARVYNDELLTYKDPTISLTAVKNAIKCGAVFDEQYGVSLEKRKNIQIK